MFILLLICRGLQIGEIYKNKILAPSSYDKLLKIF